MTTVIDSKLKRGALIAAGAAALLLAGCANTDNMKSSSSANMSMVHCAGINSCKGTSDCKTAENACKGMNACKGHGFLAVSAAECTEKGGKAI